ncbi:MAG TPA: hypothetical protein VMV27_02095 [Candidatus Binataceae bacterium]|nr:hypothetical protein [Candidatus Binataceae bacterium]
MEKNKINTIILPGWVEITSIEGERKSFFVREIDNIAEGNSRGRAGSIVFLKSTRYLFARESYDRLKQLIAAAEAQLRITKASLRAGLDLWTMKRPGNEGNTLTFQGNPNDE